MVRVRVRRGQNIESQRGLCGAVLMLCLSRVCSFFRPEKVSGRPELRHLPVLLCSRVHRLGQRSRYRWTVYSTRGGRALLCCVGWPIVRKLHVLYCRCTVL